MLLLWPSPQASRLSPTIFEAVRDIDALAFPDSDTGPANLIAIPWVALLTFMTRIHHFSDLAQALKQAHRRYRSTCYSGVMMSQQAATDFVRTFLAFHGYASKAR